MPSRALKENLDAPALNTRPPSIGCSEPRPRLTPPFPALAGAALGIGHTLFTFDSNGAIRRASPVVQVGERAIPSFALATTIAAGATPAINARVDENGQCAVMIPWRGPAELDGHPTFTSYSFYDVFYSQQQVIEGQKPGVDPARFKDQVVIIGVTAEGLNEAFTTPFPQGEINGPEVHANMVDAFLANRSIDRAPGAVTVGLVIAAVVIVAVAGSFLNAWLTGAVALRRRGASGVAIGLALRAWCLDSRRPSRCWH